MNERYRDNNKNNDGTKRNVPNASDIAKKLGVEDFSFGLASTSIVERNRKTYGKNEIDLPPLESYFSLVIQGLKDPTLVLLCASALVSFLLSLIRFSSNRHGSNEQNGTLEALSILLSVVVVVNVQASTEYQKTREFRKQQLELEAKRTSTVYRTGFKQKLHPKFLVVGDVCLVKVSVKATRAAAITNNKNPGGRHCSRRLRGFAFGRCGAVMHGRIRLDRGIQAVGKTRERLLNIRHVRHARSGQVRRGVCGRAQHCGPDSEQFEWRGGGGGGKAFAW